MFWQQLFRTHCAPLNGTRLNANHQGVFFGQLRKREPHIENKLLVAIRLTSLPTSIQAKPCSRKPDCFKQRAVRHVTRVPMEVIQDMIAGVRPMHDEMIIRNNFKTPWLRVVPARSPARKIQNFRQYVRHAFVIPCWPACAPARVVQPSSQSVAMDSDFLPVARCAQIYCGRRRTGIHAARRERCRGPTGF